MDYHKSEKISFKSESHPADSPSRPVMWTPTAHLLVVVVVVMTMVTVMKMTLLIILTVATATVMSVMTTMI